MKILLATYFTIPQEIGGFWPFMSELKAGLERKGLAVDILGRTADESGYTLYSKGQIIHSSDLLPFVEKKINHSLDHLPPGNHELQRYGLELAAAAFGLSQYDVIHCQDVIAGFALSRVKPKNIPLITSVHGSLPLSTMYFSKQVNPHLRTKEYEKTAIYRYYTALEYAGFHESQLVHTSSRWFRMQLKNKYNVAPDKMITIPYGLNVELLYNKKTDTVVHAQNKKVITFTGRLSPIKGIPYLIDALNELKKVRNDWVCWMIGDGEIMEDSVSQVNRLNLQDNIKFFGKRTDVFSLLKKSDIFVLPSLQDNQPFSVMEAQFAGLPSVVTRTGGLPEMVKHGATGLVVPPANHLALFLALQQLLNQEKMRTNFGIEARRSAENTWCFQKMIDNIIQMYNTVI